MKHYTNIFLIIWLYMIFEQEDIWAEQKLAHMICINQYPKDLSLLKMFLKPPIHPWYVPPSLYFSFCQNDCIFQSYNKLKKLSCSGVKQLYFQTWVLMQMVIVSYFMYCSAACIISSLKLRKRINTLGFNLAFAHQKRVEKIFRLLSGSFSQKPFRIPKPRLGLPNFGLF